MYFNGNFISATSKAKREVSPVSRHGARQVRVIDIKGQEKGTRARRLGDSAAAREGFHTGSIQGA